MKNKIIYSLNVEDAQLVAVQELDRELSKQELVLLEEKIGDSIDWYDAILSVFHNNGVEESTSCRSAEESDT